MTTNSAGLSGAKPTTMLTMPRLMSFCVVVSLVALDEVGIARRLPWNAPCRNRFCMNAPTFSRICAHSGSSFGSNTTH